MAPYILTALRGGVVWRAAQAGFPLSHTSWKLLGSPWRLSLSMTPHRWRWSFFRIALVAILAVACCAWRWRDTLSVWPTKADAETLSAKHRAFGWVQVGNITFPMRVYDVHELIDQDRPEPSIDEVVLNIRRNVAPKSWRQGRFDDAPSIRKLPTELVIAQTTENHVLVAHEIAWMKWRHRTMAWTKRSAWIVVPAIVLASVFELVLARRRRSVALRERFCVACGYDLRASPGRCPECGLERPGSLLPGSA